MYLVVSKFAIVLTVVHTVHHIYRYISHISISIFLHTYEARKSS
jgi:hypothetical protein